MRSTSWKVPRPSLGSTASCASTRSVNSLGLAPPSAMRSFTPRYSAGLWLLVSMMPPMASLVVRHRPAQGRRGTVVLRQLDAEAMGRGHLGGQLGVGMRILPAVVSDDQGSGRVGGAPGRRGLFLEHARGRVDYAHDVVVREAFADDGTPSVGAEMYVFHKVPFHALGSTRTPPAPSQAACRSAALAALRHARARQDHDTA